MDNDNEYIQIYFYSQSKSRETPYLKPETVVANGSFFPFSSTEQTAFP